MENDYSFPTQKYKNKSFVLTLIRNLRYTPLIIFNQNTKHHYFAKKTNFA